jgi:hypothetical protein
LDKKNGQARHRTKQPKIKTQSYTYCPLFSFAPKRISGKGANFAQRAKNVKSPRQQRKKTSSSGSTVRKPNEKTEKRTLFSAKVAAPEFMGNWSWKANKIKGAKSRLYALIGFLPSPENG